MNGTVSYQYSMIAGPGARPIFHTQAYIKLTILDIMMKRSISAVKSCTCFGEYHITQYWSQVRKAHKDDAPEQRRLVAHLLEFALAIVV